MKNVQAAQLRANISSFLFNNSGQHTTEEVATQLGVSNRTAGQLLLHMAKSKLIAPMEKNGTKKLWRWPEGQAIASTNEAAVATKKQSKPKSVHATAEVELVLGGLLVIVGKNEQTGRIRITLEEA